jgi:hypothetical protein
MSVRIPPGSVIARLLDAMHNLVFVRLSRAICVCRYGGDRSTVNAGSGQPYGVDLFEELQDLVVVWTLVIIALRGTYQNK